MKFGLGSWRFILAFFVCISHLWSGMIHGPAAYAVWGFFILSGYLMTYVLTHKYGTVGAGLLDYSINRLLRIYPAYGVAVVAGAFTLFVAPRLGISPSALNPQFIRPNSLFEWISNIFLLPIYTPGLFVPVAGALAVEVGAYTLMPLIAVNRSSAWIGFILSAALNLKLGFSIESFGERYSTFLTCFMAFSAGALLSQYKESLSKFRSPWLSVGAWFIHCSVWIWFPYWPWTFGLYVSLLLSAWVVLSLADVRQSRLDQYLGDLSYPVYLFHTTVGIWIAAAGIEMSTLRFFIISFSVTLAISWVIIRWVDYPLAKLKRKPVV
jgi:peptidoglycan/LPS O-acetylase OafA/YrhL